MLILLSPSKALDYESPLPPDWERGVQNGTLQASRPAFAREAGELIEVLRQFGPHQVANLMDLSDKLAALNVARYVSWSSRHTVRNAKPALFAFDGDVYDGLQARRMTSTQWAWANDHVRILSGLYGVLRPFDLLQPYRLEMGSALKNPRGKDLYQFWGDTITLHLKRDLARHKGKPRVVFNCASEEYFKAVKPRLLGAPVITPVFEEWRSGGYKVISFNAKRARGMFARYAMAKHPEDPMKLQSFNLDGYALDVSTSDVKTWRFRRSEGSAA
jgi:cytoplasmic iron level regulating protein YaaA (DUF328/UPF0246 family)